MPLFYYLISEHENRSLCFNNERNDIRPDYAQQQSL